MNTEQLRAEFDAWLLENKPSDSVLSIHDEHRMFDLFSAGYQAAATSRDELIGKLYPACLAADAVWIGDDTVSNNMARQLNREALAEAKAKGYGE